MREAGEKWTLTFHPWMPLRIASAEALSGAALCATFLNVLLYQGIGGSFEDTRHIWLLLGLLIGSARAFRVPDQVVA